MAALVSNTSPCMSTTGQHVQYVIAKILVMFSIIFSADSGAQIQSLRRISPIRDIHIAQVETLIKDKDGIGMREIVMGQFDNLHT